MEVASLSPPLLSLLTSPGRRSLKTIGMVKPPHPFSGKIMATTGGCNATSSTCGYKALHFLKELCSVFHEGKLWGRNACRKVACRKVACRLSCLPAQLSLPTLAFLECSRGGCTTSGGRHSPQRRGANTLNFGDSKGRRGITLHNRFRGNWAPPEPPSP